MFVQVRICVDKSSVNHEIVISFCTDDCENSDCQPKMDSVKELTVYWQRNQKQLNLFWESWKQEYLLGLRKTCITVPLLGAVHD